MKFKDTMPLRWPSLPITRKDRLRGAAANLENAIAGMRGAGYAAADTALELAEQALRQLTEDIQVTDD